MLKDLILIEGKKKNEFSYEKELIKHLLGDNYYNSTNYEKKEQIKLNGKLNCVNSGMEVIDLKDTNLENLENKFIIYDETTYLLSLLLTNRATLLEEKEANIFTRNIDKSKINGNYIIVNTFAKELLKNYVQQIKENEKQSYVDR